MEIVCNLIIKCLIEKLSLDKECKNLVITLTIYLYLESLRQ